MKETKFRAWHEKLDIMIYNISVKDSISEWTDKTGKSWCFEGKSIMQYINRKDKDGQELYEDDICELEVRFAGDYFKEHHDDAFHYIHTGVVKYTPSIGFHLRIKKTWDVDSDEWIISPKIKTIVQRRTKKIGNIHEDKHLLYAIEQWEFVEWIEKATGEALIKGYDKNGKEYTAVGSWHDSGLKELQKGTITAIIKNKLRN